MLVDGEQVEEHVTYGELDGRARSIAARLQELVRPGEPVLLLQAPGLDYVAALFGCLFAGAVAVPAYPPRKNRAAAGLAALAADAGAAAALVSREVVARLDDAAEASVAPVLQWVVTDDGDPASADEWREPPLDGLSLALLQYTSGSTGSPRGVMLTHANLLHNLTAFHDAHGSGRHTRGVSWLPPYHDMGLIGGLLSPVYGGFPMVLMSPFAFMERPGRWLRAITRYSATLSGGPNFAYDLCARKVVPEERVGLDLRSWTVAVNGAEPIRAETLERFVAAFGPCGFRRKAFYPSYGLAEATLVATGGHPSAEPVTIRVDAAALERNEIVAADPESRSARTLVGCGRPLAGRVAIVDPESGQPCPSGRVGEIWLQSSSVAAGYWKRAEETERTFGATLAGSGSFLRTGDLGAVSDGELFVTGRIKDVLVVDGRNLYAGDIELLAEVSVAGVRRGCSAAFAVEVGGRERPVVVLEAEAVTDIAGTAYAVRRAVAKELGVTLHSVVFVRPGGVQKTSSGKVRRPDCRAAYIDGLLDALGIWQEPVDAAAPPAAEAAADST